MGLSAREKPLRAATVARKRHVPRHPSIPIVPPDPAAAAFPTRPPAPDPTLKLSSIPPNTNTTKFDESGWGYCTEDQLEEIVISNLDCLYKEAISRLVSLGYDDSLALRAVLCNGHCYGAMDAVSNIMQNALVYLNAEAVPAAGHGDGDGDPPSGAFSDLRHLEEYSLAGMVCLLQQIRGDLSRGEAMWCLLMSGLHVSRASSVELPSLSIRGGRQPSVNASATPCVGEYCPEVKMQEEVEEEGEDLVQLVLKNLEAMRIEDEKYEDKEVQGQKKEMIMDLIQQIREAEGQVKERKEWAQQKAMQAARKLSGDLHELRMLRMEREENQRTVKGKQVLEDSTMKRLAEMESALKKASGQVDRANAVVKKMETENAEIRAEMEASKLSASESVTACMEVSKRERKYLKKLMAWEKQKEKMQEEIAEKRKKIVQVQQQLAEVQEATKQVEVR